MPPPVVLLAFANDRVGDDAAYLDVPRERRAIEDALDPATDAGLVLVCETNATAERLFDLLDAHNDRIVGLHFGGHATGAGLTLEAEDGRPQPLLAQGFARRIGRLPNLRWLCLNGCGTAPQVAEVHRHAAAPVVATSTAIRDDVAVAFARRFYRGLAHGASIGAAFAQAESEQRAAHVSADGVRRAADDAPLRMLRPGGAAEAPWPWVLVPRAGAEDRLDQTLTALLPQPATPPRRWPWIAAAIAALVALAAALWLWPDDCQPPPTPAGPTIDGALTAAAGWKTGDGLSARHRPGDLVQWVEAGPDRRPRPLAAAVPFMWSRDCFPDLAPAVAPLALGGAASTRLGPARTTRLVGAPPTAVAWLDAAAVDPAVEAVGKGRLMQRFSPACVQALDRVLQQGDAASWYSALTETAVAAGIRLEIGWRCEAPTAEREAAAAALADALTGALAASRDAARIEHGAGRSVVTVPGRWVLGWRERTVDGVP